MPFADLSLGICAGSVEVAQDQGAKALIAIEVFQYLLDDELASAIRIDRQLRVPLVHWDRGGDSVCGAGRGEHDLVDTGRLRCAQQRDRPADVVVEIAARIPD